MCLGIPGQVVEIVDDANHIAKAEVSGVRRNVNIGLLVEGEDAVGVGDWVLIHVGFAMSKIDEEEARQTREFLEMLGEPYEQELTELKASGIE
jgi:hydrogenase expression/formation protein HypC